MLKKRYRLKSPGLFKRTLTSRRLCGTDCFAVYALEKQEGASPVFLPRFGLIVSKKIHKRATRRNRIKRRLREIIRTRLMTEQAQALQPYYAVVIVARSGSLEASYDEMHKKLSRCFR